MTRRFRAPAGNGEVLADPPFSEIPRLVEENRRRLAAATFRFDLWWDAQLPAFRSSARMVSVIQAWDYLGIPLPYKPGTIELPNIPTVTDDAPLIVAGHQPELFHPGVWVKNFALHGLARKLGGVALNLVVDNDVPKSAAIRVPTRGATTVTVPYDHPPDVPFEEARVTDPETFATFAERVEAELPPELGEPLVRRAWAEVKSFPDVPIGEAFVRVRRQLEREWGCENLELPVSHLSSTEPFFRYLFHIGWHAEQFTAIHNAAVGEYRKRNGLRSRSHPFPDLGRDGDWCEIPFWAWSERVRRRGRVWAKRAAGEQVAFRFDNGLSELRLPYPFRGAGPEYEALYRNDVYKFRPRALTLTLFARVCLGDFFVHGIGGGKYDEVTDAIIRDYFGIEPPAYQVLSATLHLPLPGFEATDEDVKQQERLVRDLHWNPHRHLTPENASRPEVRALMAELTAMIDGEPAHGKRAERRAWFRALQSVHERLRPFVWKQVAPAKSRLVRVRKAAAANAVLRRRDYPWVLYPEETLRPFLQGFLEV